MAAKDKSQDEKNLKTLRELASLPVNRYCFDCQQRGPTYINVTVGSFVCTSCSGMLRGLNPPHRVKSITMASFTPEEMEQIKSKGNEYCKQVWLGKYDPSQSLESEYQNLQKIKDFMIQKYEDKKYYVDPEIAAKKPKPRAPAVPLNTVHTSRSQTAIVDAKPPSQLAQKSPWSSQDFPSGDTSSKEADLFRETSHDPFRQSTCQPAFRTSTSIDALLEDLYIETFLKRERILAAFYGWPLHQGYPAKREATLPAHYEWPFGVNMHEHAFQPCYQWPHTPAESSSFADFGSAFGKTSNVSVSGQFGSSVSSFPTSGLSSAQSTVTTPTTVTKPSQKKPAPPPPDRYAALADLDNQLHQQQQQTLISSVAPPTSNVPSFWGNNTPAGFGPVNYDAGAPNPFGHGLTQWPPQPTMVVPGNPFQSINTQAMTKPVHMPMPNVANGVLNGNATDHHHQQPSGTPGSNFWARPATNQPWCPAAAAVPFHNTEQDAFTIKNNVPVDRCNPWASTVNESANPFSNADKLTSSNIPQKNVANNPFL